MVRSQFGSADLTSAVPEGLIWYNAITATKRNACVSGAAHELPSDFDGASQIVIDVTTLCK